jgi:hypothetical protein
VRFYKKNSSHFGQLFLHILGNFFFTFWATFSHGSSYVPIWTKSVLLWATFSTTHPVALAEARCFGGGVAR